MYLKKIIKLQNIGKFHKGGISGGEYGKVTLMYGGNGRGKTTLCAVLRSLRTGSASPIHDRRTLGELAQPHAQLLLDSGTAAFANGKWNVPCDALHIFDGTFITENVHTGEEVSTDNRRSLYRVIVGTKGVALAEEVDALDAKVSEITGQIATEKKVLQQHITGGMAFDKFLGLPDDPQIDKKIGVQQQKIAAATKAAEIAANPLLKTQGIPGLPSALLASLKKTVAGVSADAASKLEQHLSKHEFGQEGEDWVATGLQHVRQDSCPLCGNGVKGNELVELYRKYFDESYDAFKQELIALRSHIEQNLSEAAAFKAKARFVALASEADFWRAFGPITFATAPSLDQLQARLAAVYIEAKKLIDAKVSAPVDAVNTAQLELANAEWQKIANELESCNAALTQTNMEVQAIKSATAAVNKAVLDKELQELEAINKRNSPAVQALANNYNNLVLEKAKRVAQKETKKNELDTYDTTVLAKYHASINVYLGQFGTGFSLLKSEKNYVGKVPQWMYTIEINKQALDVTKKAGLGQASFQTSMSAGDRSTLALAFFLAQLELDLNLKDAVVVFDDPFTSLDEFRRSMTAKCIVRVGQVASQVIVLSHDKHFLNDVFVKNVGSQCATFQISTAKTNSSIGPWDLKREVMEGYLQDHMDMQDFHDGHSGEAKAMRTLMRPLLESYIRYRFPNQIPDGKWLGDMLGIISADPTHPLQPLYSEIDDINQYTAPFHHDPNTTFDEDEVRTYVGRTLDVVGGC